MLLTVRLLYRFFQEAGYNPTENINDAGLILINTCSIRDNAEQTDMGTAESNQSSEEEEERS